MKLRLRELNKRMKQDLNLPWVSANLVYGEGHPSAAIVFIGEAPGAAEDLAGRPFVGRSGKLLDKSLAEIGLDRSQVYITNIVKRRPPNNRDPRMEEIKAYAPYLEEELKIIKPKIIVSLGRLSLNYFFPQLKISQVQGQILELEAGLKLIPAFHPAATFYRSKNLKDFKASFLLLARTMSQN